MSEGTARRFFISGIDQSRITTSFMEGSGCRDLCPLAKGKFWFSYMFFALALFFCFSYRETLVTGEK